MLLNQKASKEMLAAYHLQKVSGKFGRKVTGTRLFGSFRRTISGQTGRLKRWSCFPGGNVPNGNSCSSSSKSSLTPFSDFRGRISVNVTDSCKWQTQFRDEIYQF